MAEALTEVLQGMAELLRYAVHAESLRKDGQLEEATQEEPAPENSGASDATIERRTASSPRIRSH
ncbi:MAG TPA: hypothetical protein VM599_05315 [Thermoanaerobaculia bacterium]|nr:hypothetical protein [Thermoanaerobaculia bacterium]